MPKEVEVSTKIKFRRGLGGVEIVVSYQWEESCECHQEMSERQLEGMQCLVKEFRGFLKDEQKQ